MPTIYDNIDADLLDGLKDALDVSTRGDFCVGYLNLRGWQGISAKVDTLTGDGDIPPCRLIVGMRRSEDGIVKNYYGDTEHKTTVEDIPKLKNEFARSLKQQLTHGAPTNRTQAGLLKFAKQLKNGKVRVKFFGAYPLHAKLYLAHRKDKINPVIGFVGSSNLTLAGLEKQGELNVDVVEKDAAQKLAEWFEERWEHKWCLDITEELAEIIENSWAGGPENPYDIYIKTAYELSKDAIEGSREFKVPQEFADVMLQFQEDAVSLVAERLYHHNGVIISDVVGLGKTLVASAVAKIFNEDHNNRVLVICPPKLESMWGDYIHRYNIGGETLSLGKVHNLDGMRRHHLVIIDESHNLRNREAKHYGYVRRYIRENESRVMLLTATPYNKNFLDIGSQLRLFISADADLGVTPDSYIQSLENTESAFKAKHPNTTISSLAAFEHSEHVDDWRELMNRYMVRRTRSHIKKVYAEKDEEKGQHYLTFENGERFYFPKRVSKCTKFEMDKNDSHDQYASLYSLDVVDIISKLNLPRYGLQKYLPLKYQSGTEVDKLKDEDTKQIIRNLSRAGKRLIGFAKAGLFKRLESSGPAFLLSIKRHIVRNAIYIHAMEKKNGRLPIGDIFVGGSLAYESVDEGENANDLFSGDLGDANTLDGFLKIGEMHYHRLSTTEKFKNKLDWIKPDFFEESLKKDLISDCTSLLEILMMVEKWIPEDDRKLRALVKLCSETHHKEKLLIFTQFKDTADYLLKEMQNCGIKKISRVYGGMDDDITKHIKRFSPKSNNEYGEIQDDLRILITTDTLSEGQNLQDAHIIINFDMPWAIIRLIQRAGRVDRIGQESPEVLCYCFMPEDGIENIITLRGRLHNRLGENAELIGSDEQFFEGSPINLEQIYEGALSLDDDEGETDLISRAYDIWRQATDDDPVLKERITKLPDLVYSAKKSKDTASGVIAYIKTNTGQHVLTQTDERGEIISRSQSKLLDLLACEPDEPSAQPADNHHDLVKSAVDKIKDVRNTTGGQLGGKTSVRYRLYNRLANYLEDLEDTVFDSDDLSQAINLIYNYPLNDSARDRLVLLLKMKVTNDDLAKTIVYRYKKNDLCIVPKEGESTKADIICSMGLVK